jgi:vancomycin resistance protein YoaR
LIMTFDHKVLNSWLDRVDEELGLPPHDAYLTIEGDNVELVPEVDGTITDRARIQRLVYDAALSLRPFTTELPVIAWVAQVRAADLEPVQGRIERMLAKPVELTFDDEEWELDPSVLGNYLTQTYDPDKRGVDALTIGVDETALSRWLNQEFADDVNRAPVDAKVTWDSDKDELVATSKSKDGYKLKPRTLAGRVAASLMGDHEAVEIPVAVVDPRVDSNNLATLGITTKLATGDSNYEGSNEGRATNIQVGSSLLDSTLVPPGEEFSFNHAIGVIDKEKGYVEAPVIDGERIGRDIGGGICQVSTTAFRAALKSGLPITEWWPHTYRLAFYEQDDWDPGFDASILQPEEDPFSGGDFKFLNPTDSWLLVESYTENNRVYVVIYGPELDYTVTFTEPHLSDPIPPPDEEIEQTDDKLPPGTVQQTELEQEGLEVTYDRTVTDRDGNVVRQDTWDTRFESRPNVWTVSPDMEGKSPANKNRRVVDAD